jgi:hypothetical protein
VHARAAVRDDVATNRVLATDVMHGFRNRPREAVAETRRRGRERRQPVDFDDGRALRPPI